jgi:DNA-directed RNA polymerase, omega subunit
MIIVGSVIQMIYPSIDKLLNIVDSKYELVHIAARRSKEISENGYLQMPENSYKCKKNIGRALEEVEAGLLQIKKS